MITSQNGVVEIETIQSKIDSRKQKNLSQREARFIAPKWNWSQKKFLGFRLHKIEKQIAQ